MSQPDQQHKLLPQPGPWCRGGTGPRGGQQSGSGASPSFLAADVGPPSLLFLSLPRRAAPRRARRPRPAPSASAAPGAPRELRGSEAAPAPGCYSRRSLRQPPLWRKAPVSCEESRSLHCPRGARCLTARKKEMGGKSAVRHQLVLDGPREAASSAPALRPLAAAATSRAAPFAPLPAQSPRWGPGCGRAGTRVPTRAALPHPPSARSRRRQSPGRILQRRPPAPPNSSQGIAGKSPGHPFPSTLRGNPVQFCRRQKRNKRKPLNSETGPADGPGGDGDDSTRADTRPVSRSAAPVRPDEP